MSDAIFRSTARRIFLPAPIDEDTTSLDLNDAQTHYLTRVLRLRDGAHVDVADGSGRLFRGELSHRANTVILTNMTVIYAESLKPPRILVAALIKGPRWDWLLEKSAELGVRHIIPMASDHGVVRIPAQKVEKKRTRWAKILEGAARQCERLGPADIEAPTTLSDALQTTDDACRLMLDESVPNRPWPPLPADRPIALFVGPEGGWSDDEKRTLYDASVHRCGLGGNLLRAETAAISALTIVRAVDYGLIMPPSNAD